MLNFVRWPQLNENRDKLYSVQQVAATSINRCTHNVEPCVARLKNRDFSIEEEWLN